MKQRYAFLYATPDMRTSLYQAVAQSAIAASCVFINVDRLHVTQPVPCLWDRATKTVVQNIGGLIGQHPSHPATPSALSQAPMPAAPPPVQPPPAQSPMGLASFDSNWVSIGDDKDAESSAHISPYVFIDEPIETIHTPKEEDGSPAPEQRPQALRPQHIANANANAMPPQGNERRDKMQVDIDALARQRADDIVAHQNNVAEHQT